ncbi:1-phosphatidylinositol phosphodiesterase-like [Ornithorhynchus anatinus]|uniref:1-phosphatidylinositol phosphodiesterase-like n=1 Tax=Ornithorhynchus anatinus TaxID=9258 RepID=UPI0007AA73B1|nr:1-phosphatidylinositol phosphodiesterase-like [Ornithorhynchus anatinus]
MEKHRGIEFDNTDLPAATWPDWMAALSDDLSLSDLSVPGTHDSMSLFGGSRLQCQSLPLERQYEAGIRFVDVRCKLRDGEFFIYHVNTFQQADFRSVLDTTFAFLDRHPREAVLMRVKEEYAFFGSSGFTERFKRYLEQEGRGRTWHFEDIPTLGQARGKIIILEEIESEKLGIPYEHLNVGDRWKVLSQSNKWANVEAHLEAAVSGDRKKMYLTFCSGNGLFITPEKLARFINGCLYQYLNSRSDPTIRWGVVIMDFPGAELIRMIKDSNVRT